MLILWDDSYQNEYNRDVYLGGKIKQQGYVF